MRSLPPDIRDIATAQVEALAAANLDDGDLVSPWDDDTYISKGTGRETLGERAVEFPAFG